MLRRILTAVLIAVALASFRRRARPAGKRGPGVRQARVRLVFR